MIEVKSRELVAQEIISRLNELNLSTHEGSVPRTLTEGLASPVEGLYDAMNIVLRDVKLSTAKDDALGAFGDMLRMPRQLVVTKAEDGTVIERLQDDDEYRVTLLGAFDALASANEIAVRLKALLVPGIKDVIYERYTLGAGSYTAVPVTLPGFSLEEVVSALEAVYDEQSAFGVRYKLRLPRRKELNMRVLLLGRSLQANAGVAATKEIRQYIEELDPGEAFIWNEAMTRVQASASSIEDVELKWMDLDGVPRPIGNVEVDPMVELMPGKIEIMMNGS